MGTQKAWIVGSAVGIDRVDEGPGLDPGGQDAARAEQLELQPVHQHPPADALLEVTVGAVGGGDDRHLGVVDQVLADAGQVER